MHMIAHSRPPKHDLEVFQCHACCFVVVLMVLNCRSSALLQCCGTFSLRRWITCTADLQLIEYIFLATLADKRQAAEKQDLQCL